MLPFLKPSDNKHPADQLISLSRRSLTSVLILLQIDDRMVWWTVTRLASEVEKLLAFIM
jgi:hypothetical protein